MHSIKVIALSILLNSTAIASELNFQFKNPSFSGAGYSAHVLTIENLESIRRQKLVDDKKAQAAAEAARSSIAARAGGRRRRLG